LIVLCSDKERQNSNFFQSEGQQTWFEELIHPDVHVAFVWNEIFSGVLVPLPLTFVYLQRIFTVRWGVNIIGRRGWISTILSMLFTRMETMKGFRAEKSADVFMQTSFHLLHLLRSMPSSRTVLDGHHFGRVETR